MEEEDPGMAAAPSHLTSLAREDRALCEVFTELGCGVLLRTFYLPIHLIASHPL